MERQDQEQRPASWRGLALGLTAGALLLAAGLGLVLVSLSTSCSAELVAGAPPSPEVCRSAPSAYAERGPVVLVPAAVPALLVAAALGLTPVARARAAARWTVCGLLVLALPLLAFTPLVVPALVAAVLMALSAVYAHAPPSVRAP